MERIADGLILLEHLNASARHHRIVVGDITLHWREWGRGQPLILLHGGHGSWMHWVRNIDSLSLHYRVLVPDMPGFGDSQDLAFAPHDPLRLEALLDALVQSLEALVPQEPFHLMGFSFGGAIAGLLAVRQPYVQRLVLLGTAGHGGPRREKVPQQNWRVADPVRRVAGLRQNLAVFMLSSERAVDTLALKIHSHSCEVTRFRSKALSRSDMLLTALEHYAKPVLLLWGESDVTAIPMDAAECLKQGHAERDWTIVPGAGHWVQYESAAAVNTLVLRWLQP